MQMELENKCSLQGAYPSGHARSHTPSSVLIIVAALISMTVGTANAQTDSQRIAELERKLKSALTIIDKLSDKVERLELSNKTAGVSKPTEAVKAVSKADAPNLTAAKPIADDLGKTVAEQNSRIEAMQQQVSPMGSRREDGLTKKTKT